MLKSRVNQNSPNEEISLFLLIILTVLPWARGWLGQSGSLLLNRLHVCHDRMRHATGTRKECKKIIRYRCLTPSCKWSIWIVCFRHWSEQIFFRLSLITQHVHVSVAFTAVFRVHMDWIWNCVHEIQFHSLSSDFLSYHDTVEFLNLVRRKASSS